MDWVDAFNRGVNLATSDAIPLLVGILTGFFLRKRKKKAITTSNEENSNEQVTPKREVERQEEAPVS